MVRAEAQTRLPKEQLVAWDGHPPQLLLVSAISETDRQTHTPLTTQGYLQQSRRDDTGTNASWAASDSLEGPQAGSRASAGLRAASHPPRGAPCSGALRSI